MRRAAARAASRRGSCMTILRPSEPRRVEQGQRHARRLAGARRRHQHGGRAAPPAPPSGAAGPRRREGNPWRALIAYDRGEIGRNARAQAHLLPAPQARPVAGRVPGLLAEQARAAGAPPAAGAGHGALCAGPSPRRRARPAAWPRCGARRSRTTAWPSCGGRARRRFAASGRTAEGREAGRLLLEDEAKFIDLANSPLWLNREQVIYAGS